MEETWRSQLRGASGLACLGGKREILELMAPRGSRLETLEGSAVHAIDLAGVCRCGQRGTPLEPTVSCGSGRERAS